MEGNSEVQESDGNDTLKENRAESKVSPPREVLPRKLLKQWDFHLLWLAYMILGGSQTYITSVYKAFGETFIYSDRFLAIVGSLGSVGAFTAKIAFGIIADYFDSKSTLAVVVSIAVVVMYNMIISSAMKSRLATSISSPSQPRNGCSSGGSTIAKMLAGTFEVYRMP